MTMKRDTSRINRRTALRTVAGISCIGIAGCLGSEKSTTTTSGGTATPADQDTLKRVAVYGTKLVVELTADADIDHVNLIQPNGEAFGTRDVVTGAKRVTFEIGTSYIPGDYRVLALNDEETVVETTTEIRPEIKIRGIGLFRNHPEKPWDDVYGESETDRIKNGEAFVSVENVGSGPDSIIHLRFTGDVPNPIENPQSGGIHGLGQVVVSPGEQTDLYSSSFPFGAKIGDAGMGCSLEGNTGQFLIIAKTNVENHEVTKIFRVEYSGSDDMTDCDVTIEEP